MSKEKKVYTEEQIVKASVKVISHICAAISLAGQPNTGAAYTARQRTIEEDIMEEFE